MAILQKIKNFIKPSHAPKRIRERDKIKPFRGDDKDTGVFGYTDDGFSIAQNNGASKIQWNEIDRLTAYKRDLATYDEICLDIIQGENKLTVTEDTPGWHLFVEKTKTVYPVIDKNGMLKLHTPPLQPTLRLFMKSE